MVRVVDGQRVGSQLYEDKGFFYRVYKKTKKMWYLRCSDTKCLAIGKMIPLEEFTSSTINLTNPHCHMVPDQHKEAANTLRKAIQQRCKSENKSLRIIFEEECNKVPPEVAKLVDFSTMNSCLIKFKKRHVPSFPSSLDELGAAILTNVSRYGQIREVNAFHGLTKGSKRSLIFVVPQLIDKLKTSAEWHMNGTFKTVPNFPWSIQLFTIMATVENKVFPTVIALMEGKDMVSYEELFQELMNSYELRPTRIITDFENNLRSAVRTKFPDASLKGCWLHYARAVIRKVRTCYSQQLSENEVFRIGTQLLIALPLLPAEDIEAGLQHAKSFLVENGHEEPATILIPYIQKEWIEKVTPSVMSVFGERITMNNGQESYHAGLLRHFKKPHPAVWEIIDGILHRAEAAVAESERLAAGRRTTFKKKSKWASLDERIAREAQKYLGKNIKMDQYLLKCAYFFCNGLSDIEESIEAQMEGIEEGEEEPSIADNVQGSRSTDYC